MLSLINTMFTNIDKKYLKITLGKQTPKGRGERVVLRGKHNDL